MDEGAKPELSIVLPVKDEVINLQVMVKFMAVGIAATNEVVVVYDKPDDQSIPVIEKLMPVYPHLRLVHNTLGRGVVNAIRAGVAASRADVVLLICADELGPVLAVDDLLALIREGCDFVAGTRYKHGGRRLGGTRIGGFLSRTANTLFHRVSGSQFSDATTGLKMFRKECFDKLGLESRPIGWVAAFEMGIKAQLVGLKLGEVPCVSIDRLFGGESSFRLVPWFIEYLRWFIWGTIQLRRNKTKREPVRVRMPQTSLKRG